jgi:hypothetical protein
MSRTHMYRGRIIKTVMIVTSQSDAGKPRARKPSVRRPTPGLPLRPRIPPCARYEMHWTENEPFCIGSGDSQATHQRRLKPVISVNCRASMIL